LRGHARGCRGDAVVRFWSHVDTSSGRDACWPYNAAPRDPDGYRRIYVEGRTMGAHRFAYIVAIGPIPEGLSVCHRCGGRDGERNGRAKLTVAQVVEIRHRRASGERAMDLAAEFGVSRPLISYIAKGKVWAHV
jgi:hypothetical protein